VNERKRRSAMFPIDRRIGIQRQDNVWFVVFGHAHHAGIGQRHGCVTIFLEQHAQRTDMLINSKGNAERTILKKLEQGVLCPRITRQQINRLREHRLTDKERRFELLDTLDNPTMVSFRPVEKGGQRPRVNDGRYRGGRT
jgi:hypothetical protein